jgi:predicted glutamine amidotransferase
MLIAVGNVNVNLLLDGLVTMANDENEKHERNQNKNGNWKHDGGWGIAYLENNRWIVEKSTKPIFKDPKVNKFRNVKTNLVILHARKVTIGKISMENTHPFQLNEFIFCHNGTVRDKIYYDSKFTVKGDTDSEHLFGSILTENKKEKNIIEAIRNNLNKYQNYTGINFILANRNKSYVFIKKNNQPKYYQMKMGKKKDFLIVSSEELPQLPNIEWQKIKQEEIIEIDNKTLHLKTNKK